MAGYMSFDDVLKELLVDEDELKKLVSQGELRGFRDGMSMKFKKDDVLNLKKGRDTEPTIILTDSDQEMGINESSDELILDESTSDTVLNIGDIMSPDKQEEEIVFSDSTEEFSISPHDSDPEAAIPTVEVPSIDDDMGLIESDSDSSLVASQSAPEIAGISDISGLSGISGISAISGISGSELEEIDDAAQTTAARPIRMDSADETFELLDDESGEADEFVEVVDDEDLGSHAPRKTTSGRVSRSARLRAMQMKQRPSELIWTVVATLGVVLLLLPGSIMVNRIYGTSPDWVSGFAQNLRSVIGVIFEGLMG